MATNPGLMGSYKRAMQAEASGQNQAAEGMASVASDILNFTQEQQELESRKVREKLLKDKKEKERLAKDKALDDNLDRLEAAGLSAQMGTAFMEPYYDYITEQRNSQYEALTNGDKKQATDYLSRVKVLAQTMQQIKDAKQEFLENTRGGSGETSQLSKGISQQQLSFAKQLYSQDPNLFVFFAGQDHLEEGALDYYGDPLKPDQQYAIVEDFKGEEHYINVLDGNKNMFIQDDEAALNFQEFRQDQFTKSSTAKANNSSAEINVGMIKNKMDDLFESRNTVMSFANDMVLESDGGTFKQHLYAQVDKMIMLGDNGMGVFDANGELRERGIDERKEIPDPQNKGKLIPNPNYGQLENHWADSLSDEDRIAITEAVCNPDSESFNYETTKKLVHEYYTKKIYKAWWKGQGFDEDKIDQIYNDAYKIMSEGKDKDLRTAIINGEQYVEDNGRMVPVETPPEEINQDYAEDTMTVEEAQKILDEAEPYSRETIEKATKVLSGKKNADDDDKTYAVNYKGYQIK